MFDVMFTLFFVLFLVVFITNIVRGIAQWGKNNASPRLTVPVTLVAKRTHTTHHHHTGANGMHHSHPSTSYYATFQLESGDRLELHIPGREFGLMAEGDHGELTFQGTRFLGFERTLGGEYGTH